MRKLLLASAAMLGGAVALASVASAQNLTNNVPATATAISSPSTGTAIPTYTTAPPLAASTMTVRLMGRINAYATVGSDSGRNPSNVNNGTSAVNTKQASYSIYEYARLYPSFDAVAANGLRYGAALEIRQDTGAPPGGGVAGSVSSASKSRGELYFRRTMGYFGADKFGFLRFGTTDQPTSLFLTGNMENFNDGGWNGDAPSFFSGNTTPTWAFPDVGNLYTTSKAVYLSPQFFNMFDFGVSFEPSTAGLNAGPGNCTYANTSTSATSGALLAGNPSSCDATSSTSVFAETARRRNTVDAVLRFRQAFGPVGVAATIGTMQSGKTLYNGTVANTVIYDGLNVIDAGAQVTWGGLAVGAHVDAGRFNGQWSLAPKGGRDALSWVAGASYSYGPAIVGASFFDFQSAGSWTRANTGVGQSRTEYGAAAGGTLTVAPGAFLFLSYLYGHRHQANVDLLSGSSGYQTHNNVQAQGVTIGTMLRW